MSAKLLLRRGEVLEQTGLNKRQLRKLIQSDVLKPIIIRGCRRVFFSAQQIREFTQQITQKGA